jgi:hypothetical protein
MLRLFVAWVLAVAAAGCGGRGTKPTGGEPQPNPEFDKKEMPKVPPHLQDQQKNASPG